MNQFLADILDSEPCADVYSVYPSKEIDYKPALCEYDVAKYMDFREFQCERETHVFNFLDKPIEIKTKTVYSNAAREAAKDKKVL